MFLHTSILTVKYIRGYCKVIDIVVVLEFSAK
jgi:hypothetical protein